MRIALYLALTTLLEASPRLTAEQPLIPESKPAAEWTDEERFAARFLPAARLARVEAASSRVAQGRQDPEKLQPKAGVSRYTDVIDGSTHPELYLPIELFNDVVIMGYLDESDGSREFLDATLRLWKDFGASRSPEEVIRRQVAGAVQIQRNRRDDAKRNVGEGQPDIRSYCRALATSLRNAREELGPADYQALLRLLYKTVASGRVQADSEPADAAERTLRARVGGCQ